jgi:hypothetical protein
MFEKFINGFVTFVPFYYRNNGDVKFYPDDIYVNDWKVVGSIIAQKIVKSINVVNTKNKEKL